MLFALRYYSVISRSRMPNAAYTRRSAVADAVGLAPSLLPRLRAVAITVTTTALDLVSGVVCGDACVPGFECGLARESVGGVGFAAGL